MREIEFRIWDNINESLETVTELDFSGDGIDYLEIRDGDGEVHGLDIRLGGIELSQYTGIKDKNGKKIFEGDIVYFEDCEYKIGAIHFVTTEFKGTVEHLEGGWLVINVEAEQTRVLWSETEQVTIIGNKWQNPELLEAE